MIQREITMTPYRAVKHLEFKTRKNRTKSDVDAINCLVDYVNYQNNVRINSHKLFAKLFIEKFLTLALVKDMNASDCLREIERILDFSVYEMILKFKEQIPFMRLQQELLKVPIDDPLDHNEFLEKKAELAHQHIKDVLEAFSKPFSESEAIDFMSFHINKITEEYASKD